MEKLSGLRSASLVWLASLLLVLLAIPALAHDADTATTAASEAPAQDAAVDNSGFFASYEFDYELAVRKFFGLANAIPAEKYSWRPAEGVRSVSESMMHVAWGHQTFAKLLGVEAPKDWPEDIEAVTDKEEVLKIFREAIHLGRDIVEAYRNVDLDGRDIPFAGGTVKPRQFLFIMAGHMHEHLGQTIAYARSNDIAPPWQSPLAPNLEKP